MESGKVSAIDWMDLLNGTTLQMRDFPSVRLLKLGDDKACYLSYDNESKIVDVKEFTSETHGSYYYFQIDKKHDWYPLTTRLWTI